MNFNQDSPAWIGMKMDQASTGGIERKSDRECAGQLEFGSEFRRSIQYEGIKLPRKMQKRSVPRIVLAGLLPFALIALSVASVATDINSYLGWALAFIFVVLAQRHFQTLVHDASHNFYHRTRRINDIIADWLCAGFIGMRVANYRHIHFRHHTFNGSADDPEHVSFDSVDESGGLLPLVIRYVLMLEATRLLKKYFFQKGVHRPLSGKQDVRSRRLFPLLNQYIHIFVCQAALMNVFWISSGHILYAVWIYVAVTWSPLLSRLRFLVEHPGRSDLTITTHSPMFERAFFAPLGFNYHFEHHCWPTLPPYRNKEVHAYLVAQDYFGRHPQYIGIGYLKTIVRRSRVQKR